LRGGGSLYLSDLVLRGREKVYLRERKNGFVSGEKRVGLRSRRLSMGWPKREKKAL